MLKNLTAQRKKMYKDGRLGMIIDGTGDDYKKIYQMKKDLEEKGYDTYMIYINTTLEVAQTKKSKKR